MKKQNKNYSAAFTLIEVLIALFIIAIALAAAIRSTNQSIRTTTAVQNRMMAHWVAINVLSNIQIGQLRFANSKSIRGRAEMLGRSWNWDATENVPVVDMMQITVTVFYHKHPINSVTGYALQQ